jgi:hypothetical protein
MERTVMSRVELGFPGTGGCTKNMKMTTTGGTDSFGYNRWTALKLNLNGGQIGVSVCSTLASSHLANTGINQPINPPQFRELWKGVQKNRSRQGPFARKSIE